MTARIGGLRHRIVLEEPMRAPDGGGGAAVSWSEVATLWAQIKPRSGKERSKADQLSGTLSHEVIIRYRSGVTPAMRFRFGERLLQILAVFDEDGKSRRLTCLCEERDL